jgi:hypothetical protein
MLIRDRLDAAFENEPANVPIERRLEVGHAALRRRRIGQGLASATTVALICVGAVAIAGRGPDAGQRLQPSSDNTRSSAPSQTTAANDNGSRDVRQSEPWAYPGQLAYVDADGGLHVAPRAEVITHRTMHFPSGSAIENDVELALDVGPKVWWVSISYNEGREEIPSQLVGPFQHFDRARFLDFVLQRRYTVSPQDNATSTPPGSAVTGDEQLVRFANGKLQAEPGVVIQQERPDPGFANFNPDGETVAVAEVVVDVGHTRWFVIARSNGDGTTQNISARPGVGPVPSSLDDFVAWARSKYDSGVGLL